MNYQYDSLKRLTSATQTAPVVQPPDLQWGLSFTYDGFGNRWNQTIQQGKKGLPSMLTFDEARNRITSPFWSYDANGNTTAMPQTGDLAYDVDNRLLTISREGSSEAYGYLADNKRFWKSAGGVESYYLYGVGGQRILTYSATFSGGVLTLGNFPKMDVVFAGRVIRTNGVAVVMDRLGSVVTRSTGVGTVANHRYYPYGEEIGATVGDRTKFATYHRDQTGVDYADQRYYGSHLGRYLTQDPCRKADDLTNPITLNRFLYVLNDPVNRNDPSGLLSSPSLEMTPEGCNFGPGNGGGGGGGPEPSATEGPAARFLPGFAGEPAFFVDASGFAVLDTVNWSVIFSYAAANGAVLPFPTGTVGWSITVEELLAIARRFPLLFAVEASIGRTGGGGLPPDPSKCPKGRNFHDPTQPPHYKWKWYAGTNNDVARGGAGGYWYNPQAPQQRLKPDLNHPAPKPRHWEYTDSFGNKWECDEQGNIYEKGSVWW